MARAGLSRLSALDQAVPVVCYEHPAAGDLLHIDIKTRAGSKQSVTVLPHHRYPRDHTGPLGIESLFVAIEDHSRIGFTGMQASEGWPCAVAFLEALFVTSVAWGVTIRGLPLASRPRGNNVLQVHS
ncbi:MAG: hypothetical protein ACR2FI_11905 [Burkholderiales bacterium]